MEIIDRDYLTTHLYGRTTIDCIIDYVHPDNNSSMRNKIEQFCFSSGSESKAANQLTHYRARKKHTSREVHVPVMDREYVTEAIESHPPSKSLIRESAAKRAITDQFGNLRRSVLYNIQTPKKNKWVFATQDNQAFIHTLSKLTAMPTLQKTLKILWLKTSTLVECVYDTTPHSLTLDHYDLVHTLDIFSISILKIEMSAQIEQLHKCAPDMAQV